MADIIYPYNLQRLREIIEEIGAEIEKIRVARVGRGKETPTRPLSL
jgi:hypothetical protein